MIRLDCQQGSEEWLMARLAIPTASQFHRLLTPKTGKLSSQAEGYAHELLAEELLGHPIEDGSTDFMARGSALEKSAIEFYEFQRDIETERVGFILRDDRLTGCSPDRLVGDGGGLEIKCPSTKVHVSYMLGQDADAYKCQVQGALWITGRAWWDWLSYNPELAPVMLRFERDEAFIEKLATVVNQFIEYLDECRLKLVAGGYLSPERMRRDATGVDASNVTATQHQNRVRDLLVRADAYEDGMRTSKTLTQLRQVMERGAELLQDLARVNQQRADELLEYGNRRAEQLAMQAGPL